MKNFLILFLIFPLFVHAQNKKHFEANIDTAFKNAKKGLYFALSNIPESKSRLDTKLIDDDQLIASVKLYKETEGIRMEVTGYNKTYQVQITVYRSYDSLEKDGYR